MSKTVPPPSTASAILAAAGIEEDLSYYGRFTSEAERTVLTVPMRIQAAWKSNDAEAFADLFAENGSLLMQDTQLTSREEIRTFMRAGFKSVFKGAWVKGWPLSVKFAHDDVAIAITQGGILLPGETATAPERQIRATWVIVRQDGTWRLMSHQSSPLHG